MAIFDKIRHDSEFAKALEIYKLTYLEGIFTMID
jgi:hypothetical protein